MVAVKISHVEATEGGIIGLELQKNCVSRELLLFGLTVPYKVSIHRAY